MAKRVRFTRDKHRFVVTEDSCRVYRREYLQDDWGRYEREYAVSPQKRTGMIRKYSADVEAARSTLCG